MKLHYPGQRGGPFGWGVCNQALSAALYQHFKPVDHPLDADVVFMPIADHDLNPSTDARARWNVGLAFFEFPLGDKAVENAKRYDTIFVGSTWCLDRLIERGIMNGKVLIQGVDHSIFKPGLRSKCEVKDATGGWTVGTDIIKDSQFRIFSGGKFEWRKGQDLVIRAFAEFAKTHPDAHLVCSWFNPWAGLILQSLPQMGFKRWRRAIHQEDLLEGLLLDSGIPRDRFTILPQLTQQQLAAEMQNTDVGLFPNRCEGGTNLVLMEYAACGKPIVANRMTGHADVALGIPFNIPAKEDANKWAEQQVCEIVSALECAYKWHRGYVQQWSPPSWEAAAKTVAEEIERIAELKY